MISRVGSTLCCNTVLYMPQPDPQDDYLVSRNVILWGLEPGGGSAQSAQGF